MGNLLQDDFEEPLLEVVKKKYQCLYEMINKETVYLDWENAYPDLETRIEEVPILSSTSDDYIGKLSFKIKIYFNEYKEWFPNGIVASSVVFDSSFLNH